MMSPINYAYGQRVAMRKGDVVYYLHGDHLGSTSLTTDDAGAKVAESRYLPYGPERWSNGAAVTDFGFTSQRREGFNLLDYNARYYPPVLGRFVSADSIVPNFTNPQSLNRYSYVLNRPLQGGDPTGHQGPVGVSELWDPTHIQFVKDREVAELAFQHYLDDPQYFMDLYANPEAWNASMEVANLEVFAGYSILHTIASDLILSNFDPDIAANLESAHMLYGIGDKEGAYSFLAAAGVVVVGGDTCLQCGTVRPDLVRSGGRLRIDPDGASVGCANCVEQGKTYMKPDEGWRIPWDAIEAEAKKNLYCFRDNIAALDELMKVYPILQGQESLLAKGTPDMDAMHSCAAFVYREASRP